MELILCLVILLVGVSAFFVKCLTTFVKFLKSSPSHKFLPEGKMLNVSFQIGYIDKKSEACASDTDSIPNSMDKGS